MAEATLQGHKYLGRFSAEEEETECWTGSEYAEALHNFYHWKGKGIIVDIQTKEAHRFIFRTPKRDTVRVSNGQLENEIVRIEGEWGRETKPHIIKKESIYDMVLQQMYEEAKEGEKTKIIPSVFPEALKYEDLLNKGLVAEKKSGQIRLAFQK